MADTKVSALSSFTPIATDLLYGVDDPGGTPASKKCTFQNVLDLTAAAATWEFLGDTTLTGSTTEVTDFGTTSHVELKIQIDDMQPSNDNVELYVKIKTAGGVQSTNYSWQYRLANSGNFSVDRSNNSDTKIKLSDALGNATSESTDGTIIIVNASNTTNRKRLTFTLNSTNVTPEQQTTIGGGMWTGGTDALTGIEFSLSAGIFSSGTVRVWGLKAA